MQTRKRSSLSIGIRRRSAVAALLALSFLGIAAAAHSSEAERSASTVSPVVPQQVRYAGSLPGRAGETVEAVFRIYADAEGGEPLWTETQQISLGADGSYAVLLGSASAQGMPQSVFALGQARWLGVSVEGAAEQQRTLLASVPYAMKSADAEALAGHPAAEFVTQDQFAQLAALTQQNAVQPAVVTSNVLPSLTGSGTLGTVPLWTSASTLGNSILTQANSGIGINVASPATRLDVGGASTFRGTVDLIPQNPATTAAGMSAHPLEMSASTWSTTASAPVLQTFAWEVTPVGNNTATPSGNLYLQFASGTNPLVTTGLSIASNGHITFAPGQSFPITGTGGGTITGITTSSPLTGSGTAGSVALGLNTSALLSAISPSLINGITTSSPLTGGGTSGSVALGLDTGATASALLPSLNSVYAQLGASNIFTTGQIIEGASVISGTNLSGSMLQVSNSGDSFSSAINVSNSGQYGTGLYASAGNDGIGIQGFGTQTAGSTGVLGALSNSNGFSNSYFLLESDDGLDTGIWADGANGQEAALIATSDDLSAGIFFNDSSASSTILVLNNFSGGPLGNALPGTSTALRAGGPGGTCGINQSGSIACSGQVKALATTSDGLRQVETYSVQSSENWVEDYGSGQLSHGSATIALDPAFAEIVNAGVDFHVFLTPGDDCKGLYVTHKTASGFEVHELGGGTANIPFDYKIVAKRRGLETQRLVDVTARVKTESEAAQFKPLAHPLENRGRVGPGGAAARLKTTGSVKP